MNPDVPRLLDVLAELADAAPDAVAVLDATAGAAPARPLTRAGLQDLAAAIRTDLTSAGVGSGDVVGVWLPNWSHALAAQLAAASLGAVVIGINTRYNVDEVAHVLSGARPRVVLIAHGFKGLDLRARFRDAVAASGAPAPGVLVVTGPGAPPADVATVDGYDLGGGAAVCPGTAASGPVLPQAPAGLVTAFTTSGSTGRPKLAAHSETGLVRHALAAGRRMGAGPDDVVLGALPLSGVFGFNAVLAGLVGGSSVLLEPVFAADGVLADMATHRVTHLAGADDLIGRLADAWRAQDVAVRPHLVLRWMGFADFEGRSQELAAWAEDDLGATAVGVYGSSELFALTAFWPVDAAVDRRRTGGGEVVDPAIEVRVADPATDDVVPEGQEGELQFRGPNVVDAYLGDDSVMARSRTADGWFRSGDLGRLLATGTFQYVCRMGDVLRLRGFLVDPSEIEFRLARHPAVQLTKVVGAPDPSGGGTVAVAFVVPRDGHDADEHELRAWCAETLAAYKVPTRVHVIDEMPTTSGTNGTKIRTAALREMAAGGARA